GTGQLQTVNTSARRSVLMADESSKKGEQAKSIEYTRAAEAFAQKLIATEREVESLKSLSLQSTQAADQAKSAVQQNSSAMQKKLAERQKLLSQLDQAKMQEQMNKAMATLSETVGQDVPTFDEVRDKIEARYAKALGTADLQGATVESSMLELEQAQMDGGGHAGGGRRPRRTSTTMSTTRPATTMPPTTAAAKAMAVPARTMSWV